MSIPKSVGIDDFGLSLTIAAHYDKGMTNVLLASWTQVIAAVFAANPIYLVAIHDRNG